jgi:hypothetical protein
VTRERSPGRVAEPAVEPVALGLVAVIAAVTDEEPRVLTVPAGESAALPSGPLDPERDARLESGLRAWVREQTRLELGYVEQLYTFGNRDRDPGERGGGPRLVSIAWLALVREASSETAAGARFRGWYEFLPWEDWRDGRPAAIDREIAPALERWAGAAPDRGGARRRRERADIVFGLGGARWDGERVLDRYELLYETGLVAEARRDAALDGEVGGVRQGPPQGVPLALDHRRILASALGRLRGKLRYRPVVFELLPRHFTLLRLQRTVEALAGVRLHKQNFRRLVEAGGLVEGTGKLESATGGRPAEIFRFRREVLRERPAPGVGLPGLRTHG